MQQTATTGLVLRQVKVGEADQILTLLTPDLGVISASARGSLRPKNRLFSACGLFCYSEFVITLGRSSYFVDAAQIRRGFHGLSRSVEGMSLAMYLAEIETVLAPAAPESAEHLRLALNSFYMIAEAKRPLLQLKAIFELRAMTLSGYMPQLLACASCGRYDGGSFYLDPAEGTLLCADCAARNNRAPNLDAGALYALRHICLAEDNKLFNFTLSAPSLKRLGAVSERYLLAHLGQSLRTLEFLKTLTTE